MDEFLDHFITPGSWTDVSSPERSSWISTVAVQVNDILPNPSREYRRNEQNPTTCMIPSEQMMGNLPVHESNMHLYHGNSSIYVGERYSSSRCLFPHENQLQQDIPDNIPLQTQHQNKIHESRFSLSAVTESNPEVGSFGAEHGSVVRNGNEASVFPQSLEDSQSTSTVPLVWSSSYSSVPSLGMEQSNLQSFGLQGGFVESDTDILGKRCIDSELLQLENFPGQGHNEQHNSHIPSFISGSDINLTINRDMKPDNLMPQSIKGNSIKHYTNNDLITQAQPVPSNANGSNGTVKPRTRARRGQATDPHSIAERLRREKIAERMKNLQELVPNSNKADKASMLDEIIDYVKFLQLQVKVLSMSRLGAAGAVVPLITDIQAEGSSGLLFSPSVGLGEADLSESQESLAFEQEVAKLMESNVTMAMQYLQTKGLCVMPIALAAAISGRKGSCSAIPPERKKPDASPCVISKSSDSMIQKNDRQELPKRCNGAVVKQKDGQKSPSNVRDLKPKA